MEEKNLDELNNVLGADLPESKEQYLTFWTDSQLFGIPLQHVDQIIGMQCITPVPEYPDYAKGIINMRGNIIPVIDFRVRLGRKEVPYTDRTCIILISTGIGERLGCIVDGVEEVTDVREDQMSVPPHMEEMRDYRFVTGVARQLCSDESERLILCINPDKISETNVLKSDIK